MEIKNNSSHFLSLCHSRVGGNPEKPSREEIKTSHASISIDRRNGIFYTREMTRFPPEFTLDLIGGGNDSGGISTLFTKLRFLMICMDYLKLS